MRSKLSTDEIEAFAAVAHCLSFKTAAARLNLSSSALSRRIQKLEDRLDVRLLERTTREVKLTLPGKQFLARTQQISSDVDELVTAIKGQSASSFSIVRIAVIPSIAYQLLPEALSAFQQRYPSTRVLAQDLTTNEIVDAVQRGDAEFGLTSFVQPNANLIFKPLLHGSFVLAMPAGHPLSRQKRVRWAELKAHKVVSTWKGSGVRIVLDFELARATARLDPFYEVQQIYTALHYVEAGLGVAPVPDYFLGAGDYARIKTAPLTDPVVKIDLGAVMSQNHPLRPLAAALYELLERAIHKRGLER